MGEWWGECDGVREWVGAAEGRLVDVRPLAGSVDIVEEQRNSVQVHFQMRICTPDMTASVITEG